VTTVTGSVETAQLTATPLLVLSLSFSGALFPLDTLPDRLEPVARALPLSPVVELLRLGLTGTGSWGIPVLILGAWFAAGAWLVRRRFRWEPRR
jgi:ABC-2 type transport system permease protein